MTVAPGQPDNPDHRRTGRIELAPGVWIEACKLEFSFSRSSGPGGQNVNKLSTRAQLRVSLAALVGLPDYARTKLATLAGKRLTAAGELLLTADTSRSQEANRQAVLERLRLLLVEALHRPRHRRPTRPGAGAHRRRLEGKQRRSAVKATRRRPGGDE
jgi:ribosome-associated protein